MNPDLEGDHLQNFGSIQRALGGKGCENARSHKGRNLFNPPVEQVGGGGTWKGLTWVIQSKKALRTSQKRI